MTGSTGWVAFVLIGLEVMTPYLLRRNRLNEKLGTVKYRAKLSCLKRLCGAASGASQCRRAVDCDLGIGWKAGAGRAPTLPSGHQTGWPQSEPHVVEWLSRIDLTNEAARWRGTK